MPDLRTVLTETLADLAAEAAWEADRMASYGLVWAHQSKDTKDRYRRLARAALKALAEAPGVAVTQLPPPNSENPNEWIDLALGDERVELVDDEVGLTAFAKYYTREEARSIAAALLAAAVISEQGEKA